MLAQKKIVFIPCLIKDFQEVYVFSVLREKDNDIMTAMRRILIKIKGKHLLSTYLLTRQSDALCILSNLDCPQQSYEAEYYYYYFYICEEIETLKNQFISPKSFR